MVSSERVSQRVPPVVRGPSRPAGSRDETVVVLTFRHTGKLPANLKSRLEKCAFDLCAADGMQPEVESRMWCGQEQA